MTGLLADPVVRERIKNFISGAMELRGMKEVARDLRQKIEDREKAYKEAKGHLAESFALYPPNEKVKEEMRKTRAKLEKKYQQ